MNTESLKTLLFVVVAGLAAASAGWTYFANRPPQATGFELVGQPFFDNFADPRSAAQLEIAALDDAGELQTFVLHKSQGLWRIPTHSDYPAEAAERLANVSTALIGLSREAVVGRLPAEHERFGVRDPKEQKFGAAETAGKRLTLRDESGRVLADLIVGKAAGQGDIAVSEMNFDRNRRNEFYVRRADENQTYKTALNLNLSTKFSDWIDTRLIALEAPEVVELKIDNYQLINNPRDPLGASRLKQKGEQITVVQSEAKRWSMPNLDETKERVNEVQVDDLIDTVINLEIVGVREKFRYQGKSLIGPDMRLAEDLELQQDQERYGQLLQAVALDMSRRGFYLQAPEQGGDAKQLQLISESGQVSFTTNEGFVFYLDLGKSIDGDLKAVEIGTADAELDQQHPASQVEKSENGESESPQIPEPSTTSRKNRFVFIRVGLDENRIAGGPPVKPTPPVEPTKPGGYLPPPAEIKPKEQDATGQQEEGQGDAQDDAPPPVEKQLPRDPAFAQYDEEMAKFESAKIEFEINLSRFEMTLEQYNASVDAARKRVAEMNERYGAWYYVVSALNLEGLRTDRASLIEAIVPPAVEQTSEGEQIGGEGNRTESTAGETEKVQEQTGGGGQQQGEDQVGKSQDGNSQTEDTEQTDDKNEDDGQDISSGGF